MPQNFLLILGVLSLDFEAFLEPNCLIVMNICSLSILLKVKAQFNSAHLFLIASIYAWSLFEAVIAIIVVRGELLILDSKSSNSIEKKLFQPLKLVPFGL